MIKDRNFCIINMYFLYCYTQPLYTAVCICILNGQYKNTDRNLVEQYFGNAVGNNIALRLFQENKL